MKETGIIMSGNHPKLILNGIKTMTRRVIKTQPHDYQTIIKAHEDYWSFGATEYDQSAHCVKCPYGQVGDRLWVKESYWLPSLEDKERGINLQYNADVTEADTKEAKRTLLPTGWKHKPSIFMPYSASRILLEITEVRVERLKEITPSDIAREGVKYKTHFPIIDELIQTRFAVLWDSLNAKRSYSWESNPWVWVISFKRV